MKKKLAYAGKKDERKAGGFIGKGPEQARPAGFKRVRTGERDQLVPEEIAGEVVGKGGGGQE